MIFIFTDILYIYIYIRDPSVSWPIYGEGGERTRGDGGEGVENGEEPSLENRGIEG